LNYCILSNNTCKTPAGIGSGGGSFQSPPNGILPALDNCLVISNYCYGIGGGVYAPGPGTVNCTIVGNTATNQAGGTFLGSMENCIVYGYYCTSKNFGSSSNILQTKLTNCCITDPLFINPSAGNYRPSSNSPCINSGNNAYVLNTNDLDGNPRIVGGTVDIGAYEYQTPSSIISYSWLEQYGLPTDGSADIVDSDGTGMNNWQKWIAGLNPTNPASMLVMTATAVSTNFTGVRVTWQTVNTRTYYVQRTSGLAQSFSAIQSNLVGQAGTTTYTDATATNGGPYFYRVGVQY
jgi:parallel beta-helix repeat protein